MKHNKRNINFFLLLLIILSFSVPSIHGNNEIKISDNDDTPQEITIDLSELRSSAEKEADIKGVDVSGLQIKDYSIYDAALNEFLTELIMSPQGMPKQVKVIFLFDEVLDKSERVNLLNNIFNDNDDFEIIYNYNIIPGISASCNPIALIENAEELSNMVNLEKIFKSITYSTPIIKSDVNGPKSSALLQASYSNWWVPAVSADGLSYDGSGVRVAVIDSGVFAHGGLNIVANQNFVSGETSYNDINGHGTHCAGIIGGDGYGSSGKFRGIAPEALIINARAGDATGGLDNDDIIDAIEWCVKSQVSGGAEADIISMSFGGGSPSSPDPMTMAISNATDQGVICVVAAGNSGPGYHTGGSPASGVDAISVGATDSNNNLASFSSWGPTYSYLGFPDIVAPGVNIISCDANASVISREKRYIGDVFDNAGVIGDYVPLSGTSMATPVVAGALAILKQAFPKINPETARISLLKGAKKLSKENEDDFLKSGAGLINITASLNYLDYLNATYTDINNASKIFPDNLPVKPFDLLHFPGDYQEFNLTVISGINKSFNVEIPTNVPGIEFTIDKSILNFTSDVGVNFTTLGIEILKDAIPGIYSFKVNLTSGGTTYDSANITLDIKLPEHEILMESYHGLNDWYPELSFAQLRFYDAMSDIVEKNISIDYMMEYWTPGYDKNSNNSILTLERLYQYDLVVLQNPILPYSPIEIDALRTYFNNGGNILFLGTRYNDLCTESLNHVFSSLGVDVQVNEETLIDITYLGGFYNINSKDITSFSSTPIFSGVSKFFWRYGATFTTSGAAESIAEYNSKTVAAAYNGTSSGKGRFVAFGDLNWMIDYYNSTSYQADHSKLLSNLLDYLLPNDNVSINIGLRSERISNAQLNISLYLKNQTTDEPFTSADYDSLTVTIQNDTTYLKTIIMDTAKSSNGIYSNYTYNVPTMSSSPYTINVTIVKGAKIYKKTAKIMHVDDTKVPIITEFKPDVTSQSKTNSVNFDSTLSLTGCSVDAYMGIYPYLTLNTKKNVNKTLAFIPSGQDYFQSFTIDINDPSGYALTYIVPESSDNYINPNSPRVMFTITNGAPVITESQSYFGITPFTYTSQYYYIIPPSTPLSFKVKATDDLETASQLRTFISLFISTVSTDNWVIPIFPSSIWATEIPYSSSTGSHEGNITLPISMNYGSITGIVSKNTTTDYHSGGNYIALLFIYVYDKEGGIDLFNIMLSIGTLPTLTLPTSTTTDQEIPGYDVFIMVGLISLISMAIIFKKQKRKH